MESLSALDASSPTLLQTVRAHSGEVSCADARGARLATGGGDRALRLWGWARPDGWREAALASNAHRYGVTAVRWSPGGALLASGGVDGATRVWCARTLNARRALAAPGAAAVRALCWAGARVLAGHDDGAVRVWIARSAALLARVHAHEGALHALAAPAGGALLLAACTEGVLKVYDLQEVCRCAEKGLPTPNPLTWVDNAHDMGVLCADACGARAATGGRDARVRVWRVAREDVRRLEPAYVLVGHAAAVTGVRWAGRLLASAALDRTARLWAHAACLCVLPAHARYLTCVALAPDLRYLITGSNDKTVRMWSLGSLTLDDDLEPPCVAHQHFGVGDLEGIGPVDTNELLQLEAAGHEEPEGAGDEESAEGAQLVWRAADAHEGAINCIATSGDLLATASSDGTVRIFRLNAAGELQAEHTLGERGYPALAADFGAAGAVLLTGGLDATAQLWDVETGVLLRLLTPPAVAEEETGGGGVRGARVSPHRPPLLLLATDDGTAPLWSLADPDPKPIHVYGGHAEAAVSCAWSPGGRLAATGGAAGELRVHHAPPLPATLAHHPEAHELGVQSCDFAPSGAVSLTGSEDAEEVHLLATGGSDGFIKLWLVELFEDLSGAQVTLQLMRAVEAHGGGVTCVRWGPRGGDAEEGKGEGGVLVSGGAERWARAWRVRGGEQEDGTAVRVRPAGAVPAAGAGGAAATALLDGQVLAVGTLTGELALWQLSTLAGGEAGGGAEDEAEEDSEGDAEGEGEGAAPRWWGAAGVARWLREYVTRAPDSKTSREEEALLLQRARDEIVTGTQLLDESLDELLELFGYGPVTEEIEASEEESARAETRLRLADELKWLRRDSPPPELAWSAPHALLCPLTHQLLREPARAADGCTYERAALYEWFLAADGAVSGVSGRRLRNARVSPNYGARAQLKDFLAQHPPMEPEEPGEPAE